MDSSQTHSLLSWWTQLGSQLSQTQASSGLSPLQTPSDSGFLSLLKSYSGPTQPGLFPMEQAGGLESVLSENFPAEQINLFQRSWLNADDTVEYERDLNLIITGLTDQIEQQQLPTIPDPMQANAQFLAHSDNASIPELNNRIEGQDGFLNHHGKQFASSPLSGSEHAPQAKTPMLVQVDNQVVSNESQLTGRNITNEVVKVSPELKTTATPGEVFYYRFASQPGAAHDGTAQVNPLLIGKTPNAVETSTLQPASLLARTSKHLLKNGLADIEAGKSQELMDAKDDRSSMRGLSAAETRGMTLVSDIEPQNAFQDSSQGGNADKDQVQDVLLRTRLQDPNVRAQLGSKVADRVQVMLSNGQQHAKIQLDPPELGMLEIKIQFQKDQVQVNIISQNPQVRDVLEGHSFRLREMLEENGVSLGQLSVQDNESEGSRQFNGGQNHNENEYSDSMRAKSQQVSEADEKIQTLSLSLDEINRLDVYI